MSQFTATFTAATTYDGDDVAVELRRLTNAQLNKLEPYFFTDEGQAKVKFKDRTQMIAAMAAILPEVVVTLKGVTDKDGRAVELSTVLEHTYFATLVDWMVGQLFLHSRPMEKDIKKSEAPSLTESVAVADGVKTSISAG